MKKLILLGAVTILTACQSTGNKIAGICQIEQSVSTFENSKLLEFTECWSAKSESVWDMPTIMTGYVWNESNPDSIKLNLVYNGQSGGDSYTGFYGIDINIDGNIYKYKTSGQTILSSSDYNTVSNTIYTKSRNAVTIPLSVFEDMVNKSDVRIRIYTSDGYEDQIFSLAQNGMSKYTRYYIPEYLDIINKNR